MNKIFYSCQSLTSIDMFNFKTKIVTNMILTFSNCNKLKILNLSNFKTSFFSTFYYNISICHSFTSLNITNFITSNTVNHQTISPIIFINNYSIK